MKRMTKTPDTADSANVARTAQAKFTSRSREIERANGIDDSPAMVAQRKKLDSLFGGAIQRVEEEEPLQGKFETVQRIEEEEPLQGKFEAVQRVEEEEPLQGKFDTAQRVEEEEPLQGKFEAVQRVEEEEPLQGKFETAQRVEEEEPLQGKFEAASSVQLKEEAAAKPNNTGLPDNLKSGIESLSGMSMDNVRVHYNSSQPAQLNALAYAQGTDIHVAPGQEQHLPHEAWHVVQQAQGRVKPTMQMKDGVPVNDDHSLEHEADVMGAKATSVGVVQGKSIESDPIDSAHPITQRMVKIGKKEIRGGEIVNPGERPKEFTSALAMVPRSWLVITELHKQSNGGNPPVYSYSDWDQAVKNVSTWLERGEEDKKEDKEEVEESKKSEEWRMFMKEVKTIHDGIKDSIKDSFMKKAKESKTLANQAHMSLAQAAKYAAELEAYSQAKNKYFSKLSKNEKKDVKNKMKHLALKAKQGGEEHHFI